MSAVPKLRFPEFDGDWRDEKLGGITEKIGSGVTPKGGQKSYLPNGIPLIRSQNVNGNKLSLSDVAFIDEVQHQKMSGSVVKNGDILLNITGASIGRSCTVDGLYSEANVNQHVCIIRLTEFFEAKFLQPILSSDKGKRAIYQAQSGSGREGLNFENIGSFKFSFPSLPEQKKIASFLSSVDKKIDLLRQKKDALELYKKGLMQKIFSQEIRFKQKDGSDFPDWEEVALGDVVKIRTGKKDVNQGNPQGSYPFFTCAKHNTYSDTYSFDCDAILIAGNGEVGHSQRFSGKFEAYQRTYVLSDFKLKFDYTFVVVNNLFKEFVNKQVQTGAMPFIRLSTLKDFLIPCPSPEEQLKIAKLFSKIDQKIQNTSSQVEQMETFKKGLLQQMFV